MSRAGSTATCVEELYGELVAARAASARVTLTLERQRELVFAQMAAAFEQAAGALLHSAASFGGVDGRLPGRFAGQASALLVIAARFEETADLIHARTTGEEGSS
jgi:hypothetical protein